MNTPGLLTADQARLVELLLAGHTQRSAAREMGKEEAQISRWARLPLVVGTLAEARAVRFQDALSAVHAAALPAIQTLIRALSAEGAPWSVRVVAACKILEIIGLNEEAAQRFRALAADGRGFVAIDPARVLSAMEGMGGLGEE